MTAKVWNSIASRNNLGGNRHRETYSSPFHALLTTELYSDFDLFLSRCGEDWQCIVSASDSATIFQSREWIETYWKHFGTGRKFRAIAFSEGEKVVGLAVCFLPGALSPLQPLRFVGDGVSDYLDFIAEPGKESIVSDAFSTFIKGNSYPYGRKWDGADFAQIRPVGLSQNLKNAIVLEGETCPFLPLPSDVPSFRRGLPRKLRQNLGYYQRALTKLGELEFRIANANTLERDMYAFFSLHQHRWRRRGMPGAFASKTIRAFHMEAAQELLHRRWLRLHTLSLDGEIKAALYCFQKGTTCYYYLSGFAEDLSRYSVGTVMTARAIEHAIEFDSAKEFDFLRGNEGYKYRWGAQDRYNTRLIIPPSGVKGTILKSTASLSLRLELRLKDWMHGNTHSVRVRSYEPEKPDQGKDTQK